MAFTAIVKYSRGSVLGTWKNATCINAASYGVVLGDFSHGRLFVLYGSIFQHTNAVMKSYRYREASNHRAPAASAE